jgi:hypothetical protein
VEQILAEMVVQVRPRPSQDHRLLAQAEAGEVLKQQREVVALVAGVTRQLPVTERRAERTLAVGAGRQTVQQAVALAVLAW